MSRAELNRENASVSWVATVPARQHKAMIDYHRANNADLTVAALQVSREEAKAFGVMTVDESQAIVGFEEKPQDPTCVPGEEDLCLASICLLYTSPSPRD